MAIANPPDLVGVRVLITRPADRSAALLAALRAAGAKAVSQPLLEITPLSAVEHRLEIQACRQRLMNLDCYQHLIFISVNAVKHGLEAIEQLWPQWPIGVKVHAIGTATATALADRDVDVEAVDRVAMNSESLLASPMLQYLQDQKVLIVRGLGGREYLAEQLAARGAQVDYAECYQRLPSRLDREQLLQLLRRQNINIVCLNSGETLEHFTALLADAARHYTVLVPGERVASMAEGLGFKRVIQAENAGTAATLAALRHYVEN